ncbi:MAG: DUF488 family protein, partial [Methyloceanibacter sp.]|nr:DUF488 family protein [Methyloceanibacter sp.]
MSTKVPAGNVKLKRAYEPPAAEDGTRILIDRLWPRGISKERAAIDQWIKDISPSTALRKWFGHDPARWNEFRRRYAKEVQQNASLLGELRTLARKGPITLVYSAHDEVDNDAVELCLEQGDKWPCSGAADSLTPDKGAKIVTDFQQADTNKNGKLSKEEFQA